MLSLVNKQIFNFAAKKVCIVGGVAGGASCAARLRRLSEDIHITMFEKGEHISFANCGLPYYIGGVIQEREKLVVQTVENMSKRFNLDIRNLSEVQEIDRINKRIKVKDYRKNETYWEEYDKLVLAPGASPIKPPIKGIEKVENIFTLRNIPDTDKIKNFCDEKKPKHAIVIGGGFIGLEMVEMFKHRGIEVTLVEMADHIMGPLDYEMASLVHQHLKLHGVELYLNDKVVEFEQQSNENVEVNLSSGTKLEGDMVVLSIGVKPDMELAVQAGLETNRGIITNSQMKTSDPNIYAVGDVVEVQNIVTHHRALIPLAGPANKQGRIVADQIVGRSTKFKGSQGTGIVKVFDINAATTGCNERMLKQNNIEYLESITHSSSHAGYYPGANSTAIKILFSPYDGRIYGAQVVGGENVDKRIDVLATAVRHHMTVFDLEELELSYAPPFSSAKDPVNYAGFVGANIINGDVKTICWSKVQEVQKNGGLLIDVRTKEEYEMGTIPGSINIDLNTLRDNLDKIPKDKEVVIFCQAGLRAYVGYSILRNNGYTKIYDLSGGFKTWHYAFLKQSNENIFDRDVIKSCGMVCQQYGKKFEDPLNSNYVYWDKDFEKFSPIEAKKQSKLSHPLY